MSSFSFNFSDFVFVWWGLLFEAIPFVVVGSLISGIVERFLSRQTVARLFPRRRSIGIAASGCLGLLLPMCECGVVPVVRRLILKGVPPSCAVAYLLASPIVNPLVIASTAVAFYAQHGWMMVVLRVGLGYGVAVLVAAAVWWMLGDAHILRGNEVAPPDQTVSPRRGGWLGDVLAVAAGEFIVVGGTLAIGAAIAALINSGFSREAMLPLAENRLVAVPGMMLLAVALNLCSEADAFVAASFYAFPIAAQLAFLVMGPMVDIKLMLVYTAVFRTRVVLLILGTATLLILGACLASPWWMPLLFAAGHVY